MSKHYSGPFQYLTCKICKLNKHISYYSFKVSDVGFVFISKDIDLGILKIIDSKNMLRCII